MKNQYYHNSNINSNSNRQPYNNNNYNNNSYNANSYNTQDNPNTKLYSPENSEVEGVQPKKVPAKKANHLTIEEVNYSHGKAVDSPVSMTTEELKSSSDTPTKESSFSKFSANSAFRSVEISSEKVNNRTNNGDINTNRTKNKKKSDRFSLTPGPKYGSSDDNDSRKRGITPSELSSKSPIAFNLFDDRSKVYWQNRLSPEKNINFQDSSVSPDVYNMLNQALGKQSMNNTYGSILDQVDLSQSVNDRLDDHLVNEWNRMKPEVAAAAAAAAFDPDHTFLVAGIGKRRVIQANIPEVPLGQSPPRPGQYYNQIYGASPSSHRTNTGALSSITSPHSSITDGYFATSSQDSFAVTSRSNDGMQFPNAFPNSPYKNYPPSGRGRSSPHMVHANSDSVMHFGQNRNKNNLTRHSFNITELHHNGFNGNMHGEMDNFHSYEYHHGEDLDPNLVASQYYMNNNLPGYPNQPDSRRAVEIDHNIPVAQPFYNLQLGKANGMMGQGYDPTTRNFSPNVNSKYKQHHRSDESDQKVAMHKYHQFSNAHENYGHGAFEPKFQRHHSGIYRSGDESAGSKGQNAGKRRNNGHHSADSDSSGTYSAKSLKAKMKADQQKHSKEVKPVVATKPELVESPRSKHAYKEFFKEFRNKEKDSVDDAVDYGIKTLETITDNAKWRVYLELADISKRNHDLDTARKFYASACSSQPRASIAWIEWSKMEEENGKLRLALNILILGLKVCKISESIVTRVIKLQERLHKYESVREMLSLLKNESIDKVWKSILEGSLFEARAGNIAISRKLLNYLMKHVPWYGPIYLEAFRLEERENNFNAALSIIRKGLKELPRYGPLWFGLMRLIEMSDSAVEKSSWVTGKRPALAILHKEVKEALKSISKELTWKVHYELSQAEERAADIAAFGMHTATGKCLKECKDEFLVGARLSLVNALLVCPGNLRWKIFLAGARMELSVGKVETARELLRRAFAEVPIKSKATVYLECARVEEFVGNLTFARQILLKARIEIKSEWKLFLEAVMLEARNNNLLESLQLAKSSVKLHPGTGRLWAMYIQLCHRVEFTALWSIELGGLRDSTESQMSDKHGDDGKDFPGKSSTGSYVYSRKERVIAAAIAAVPKSGEVWCERSRCYLNPFNVSSFDLLEAQRSLSFAIQFTPQYGDSFLELIRIELLCQVLLPVVFQALKMPFVPFLKGHLIGDEEADLADFVDNNRAHEILNSRFQPMPVPAPAHERQVRRQRIAAIENMEYRFGNLVPLYKKIMISNLHRRCLNADPNYGSSWFYCRNQSFENPILVLQRAMDQIIHDLVDTQKIYARAILHFVKRCLQHSKTVRDSPIEVVAENKSSAKGSSPTAADTRKSPNSNSGIAARDNLAVGVAMSIDLHDLHLAETLSEINDHSLTQMNPLEMVQLQREEDLLLDIEISHSMLANFSSIDVDAFVPLIQIDDGNVYNSTDFISGIIDMNKSFFNPNIAEDTRRKYLFGCDQIV